MKKLFTLCVVLLSILQGKEDENIAGINKDTGNVSESEERGAVFIKSRYIGTDVIINNVFYGEGCFLAEGLPLGRNEIIAKIDGCDDFYKETINVFKNIVDTVIVSFENPHSSKGIGLLIAGSACGSLGIIALILAEVQDDERWLGESIPLSIASAIILPIGIIKRHNHKKWERENPIYISPSYDISNNNYGLTLNVSF